ncbi:MAG: glycosyltransferase [Kiritimatiellae bacterium]|jgi:GT2 family glycosyltransferase|nr:glycosyltransferase [Kiritimatiellia bacterium]HHU15392.1 glycosyltransferase [Lentisphaerota bacterium]HON46290.1 glycosyltransferase [Kiritimatiellia bacterium]
MTYSLITLSHNKLACTRRCLSALLTDTLVDAPWEMIVVDNGSTDGSAEWCDTELVALGAAHGVPVTVLHNPGNIGCSFARNRAVAVARGTHLVFVDNDVAPRTRRWMQGLRAALESRPGVGMAGAKMVYPWAPYPIQCAGVGISRRGHVCFRGRGAPIDDPRFARLEEVQCLISACLMIPAELLQLHGGFDEAFHPVQFEDFDLVYRLREAGHAAVYTSDVEMYHFESVTTQGTPTVRNAAVVVRNGLLFQKRWRHLFEHEDGPPEEACRWLKITPVPFDAIGDLPTFE